MKVLIKYLVSGVFVFSAFTKLADYQNTMTFFDELFGFGTLYLKIFLSVLILLELIIAYLIFFDFLKNTKVYASITVLMNLFVFSNILFAIYGINNCGCFGTAIMSSPVASLIKNIFLLYAIYYLRKYRINIIEQEILKKV